MVSAAKVSGKVSGCEAVLLLAVKNRAKLAAKRPCLHGSKRETAALTATPSVSLLRRVKGALRQAA